MPYQSAYSASRLLLPRKLPAPDPYVTENLNAPPADLQTPPNHHKPHSLSMGRRKDRIAKEDYSSDSGGSESEGEGQEDFQYGEFESFTQPSRRKKRRHAKSKEDAMLGVFGEDSGDDDRGLMRKNIRYREVAFVEPDQEGGDEGGGGGEEEEDEDEGEARPGLGALRARFKQSEQESESRQATEEAEEDDWRPKMGNGARVLGGGSRSMRMTGLGFRPAQQENIPSPMEEEEQEEAQSRPTFKFHEAHSQEPPLSTTFTQYTTTQFDSDTMHTALPAAPIRSLLASRKGTSTPSGRKYGMGAAMLEKMGYKQGQGLGTEGQGILNPIETKLRPERVGLGAVKEMTAQAKEEARRRGQLLSDDEEDKKRRGKNKSGSGTSTPRSRAKKVVYQTAEEMAGGMEVPKTIQKLVDLQGREVELSSLGGGKMEDELRIAQMARRDLKRFGDEWKGLQEQRKYVEIEVMRAAGELSQSEEHIRKAEVILEEIESIATLANGQGREGFDGVFEQLSNLQTQATDDDIKLFDLDEVVVGLLAPMVKQAVADWNPLQDATLDGLTDNLKALGTILCIRSKHQAELEAEAEVGLLHHKRRFLLSNSRDLIFRSTPYESLLFHAVLPKIRSTINNSWTPFDPQPVIVLIETWETLLPGFIYNMILEQVVIPKLHRAIDHWNPRRTQDSVHLWIFPWLPHLGSHMDDMVKIVQHKFKVVLETWDVSKGIVNGLEEWRELFGSGTLEELLLKFILPKLALELREKFVVDPSDQQLDVLTGIVMPWRKYFRASTWGQLLESEFFSKWLGMLHLWLTSEGVNLEEVGQWYEWWKHQVFEREALELEGVRRGFKAGLDLMSKAADYMDQGIPLTKLPAPITGPQRPVNKPVRLPKKVVKPAPVAAIKETTFKDVLEDLCAENNLLFVPMRTADQATGKALFRITASADGKGGTTGYIGEGDVLWLQTRRQGPYEPVGLDKVVSLAERR